MATTVDIPFPTSSNPGQAPGEGSGRVLNCYAYKDGDGVRWRPLPGLTPFASTPAGTVRGMLVIGNLVYAVVGSSVLQVAKDGTVVTLDGTIAGTGPVTMARNNALPPDITITSEYGAYVLIDRLAARPYPASPLPQVNSVTFLDGYFLWTTPSGEIWASDLNSTNVNALSVARAEAKPDGLLRGIVYGQQLFAFGTTTTEVWQDAGTSPFPLTRSTVIPIGLAGPWAVAGQEDGWGGPLIFVAANGSVRQMDGYTPTRISGEDLERLIQVEPDRTALRAGVYTFRGHAIWSLSSPDWTWEYNCTTGEWHERQSVGLTAWRAGPAVKAFDRWIAPDLVTGGLDAIDDTSRFEGSDPLVWGLDSGPVKKFPARIQIPGVAFDFVRGAAPIGEDPQIMLSWSHDGGARWASPLLRGLGKIGQRVGRIAINRIGLSSPAGVRFRFRVSDPAYTSFAGARADAALR